MDNGYLQWCEGTRARHCCRSQIELADLQEEGSDAALFTSRRAHEEARQHGTAQHIARLSTRPQHRHSTQTGMGDKNKHNGQAEDNPRKDEEVGAEGDETTDDEGGVDTPPPQKDEEDTANEDGTFEVGVASMVFCRQGWDENDGMCVVPGRRAGRDRSPPSSPAPGR